MKKFFRWTVACVVIVFSLLFFVYPAIVVCAIVFDSQLAATGQSRFVPAWFEATARRYTPWADAYLQSGIAKTYHHNDVAATEWPMFGSTLLLVTANDLQHHGKIIATRGAVRDAVDRAVQVIASPVTATWVKTKWGDAYLDKENVFYRMLLILGLESYEEITGDRQYHALMTQQSMGLSGELMAAKNHVLDDYPEACYPNDVLWSVAAMQRVAHLNGTNCDALVQAFMASMDSTFRDTNGLPCYQVQSRTGLILQEGRGCGNSGILPFAAELDPDIAARWYKNYEARYWRQTKWIAGFTELPGGEPADFMDVDSGPVVFGFGSVASAFGIGASKALGRVDHAVPLTMEAVACSWPTPFGFVVPSLMGWKAAGSRSLGDIGILFSMTRPMRVQEALPFTGPVPWIVWAFLAGYAGAGFMFIWLEIRGLRQGN